ncbi:putative signal peptide protein, partial [Puccinia sorghi]
IITISQVFHHIIHLVCCLALSYIAKPTVNHTHHLIARKPKYIQPLL